MKKDPQPEMPPQAPMPAPEGLPAASWSRTRWIWVILVAALAAAIAGAATWERTRGSGSLSLQGAVFMPPVPAYDFRLPDQDGRMVSLSSLRGRAVVLTFLYTLPGCLPADC